MRYEYASFALGWPLGAFAIVAGVYTWPSPDQWIAPATFTAMMTIALATGATGCGAYLLARDEAKAQTARGKAKLNCLFVPGGLGALVGHGLLLTLSIRIGGIA